MTIIFDDPPSIPSQKTLRLFDDTSSRNVWFCPLVWKLYNVGGKPAITYYNNSSKDISFLQMIFEPWWDDNEYKTVAALAQARGAALTPVNYLGKNEEGKLGSRINVLQEFPDDPTFRFKVNGGRGGSFQNTIPVVFNMNSITGEIIADQIRSDGIGLVFEFASVLRGAQASFDARVLVNYDRCYEVLQARTSWDWWLVSGDIQSAWQSLEEHGGVKVEITGGTPDQKAIVYRTAEFIRDLFLKPSLNTTTAPSHPDSGIIKVSLRYEKINEHKVFEVIFKEREFIDAPLNVAVYTGQHDLKKFLVQDDPMLESLFDQVISYGTRVDADYVPLPSLRLASRLMRSPDLAKLLNFN